MKKENKIGKTLVFKFFAVSIVISAITVLFGFWGTHLILESSKQQFKRENNFAASSLKTIQLLRERTNLTLEEILAILNAGTKPGQISLIKREQANFPLPEKVNTLIELQSEVKNEHFSETQIYNLDGNKFIVFKHRGPGGPGGPNGKLKGEPFHFFFPIVLSFLIMLLVLLGTVFMVYFIYKRQAQKAAEVLRALKAGDLKARFPISKLDEAGELMGEFNLMASEIEMLVTDLRDVDHMRKKLLQELAHDLRTPLASMKSLLESLLYQKMKMTEDQKDENLNLTIKEVEYFQHLVEDLLFLSGVHDLNFRGNISHVDVVDVIQHEVQLLSELNKSAKIKFIYDDFSFVKADPHLFQRLMKNAISNAVENAKDSVSVRAVSENGEIKISISNNGNKLKEDEISTFGQKRFSRKMENSTNGKISIGLGAVIMAKICEILLAKMSIRNNGEEENAGVTLEFRIPV
jgi:signal transduction histidine kinase